MQTFNNYSEMKKNSRALSCHYVMFLFLSIIFQTTLLAQTPTKPAGKGNISELLKFKEIFKLKEDKVISDYEGYFSVAGMKFPITQSFCLGRWNDEKNDIEILSQLRSDQLMEPASVSKVYTTLLALETFPDGANHRFSTKFILEKNIMNPNLPNLKIIGGRDGFFTSGALRIAFNHLWTLLNPQSPTKIHIDKIILDDNFFINFTNDKKMIKKFFHQIFVEKNPEIITALQKQIDLYNLKQTDPSKKLNPNLLSLQAQEIIYQDELSSDPSSANQEIFSFNFLSAPIYKHLKPINNLSNNFYMDQLFTTVGGAQAMSDYLSRTFGQLETENIKFASGSGLRDMSKYIEENEDGSKVVLTKDGSYKTIPVDSDANLDELVSTNPGDALNWVTCSLTLKIYQKLKNVMTHYHLKLWDILPVPTLDSEGTLKNRLPFVANKMCGKTGTLNYVSALSGMINSHENDYPFFFTIFNTNRFKSNGQATTRNLQDAWVNTIINQGINVQGQTKHFSYKEILFDATMDFIILN